jgi:sugar/nucleoside kinase (ribokinase family)
MRGRSFIFGSRVTRTLRALTCKVREFPIVPNRAPHIAGAGLLALDVILCDSERPGALSFAGGTCGNVLSILSYLRWSATPIGYIGDDPAGKRILADLTTTGVRATHLIQCAGSSTPVFIQRLQRDEEGRPQHTFASADRCPHCGQLLAGQSKDANVGAMPIRRFDSPEKIDVFFMDRLSDDVLSLAESARSRGALVFYEPSAKSDIRYWQDGFELIDIVKYSADRFDEDELAPFVMRQARRDFWEVQTLGARGLKYRRHMHRAPRATRWVQSAAIAATRLVDTCGAGDWCSAGILHGLIAYSQTRDVESFATAVRLGQLLAAWACAFVGARGAMYCNDGLTTSSAIKALIESHQLDLSQLPTTEQSTPAAGGEATSGVVRLCPDY